MTTRHDTRWNQAEGDFRAVMPMVEAYPVAHYNLGMTLPKQLRDEEGAAELRASIDRAGSMPEVARPRSNSSARRYT